MRQRGSGHEAGGSGAEPGGRLASCLPVSRSSHYCGRRSSSRRVPRRRITVSCTGGAAGRRGVLPGAVAARQGGAFDPWGELHRIVLRGRCTSRTGSSPGRRSRPTIRRWARTRRSTSRAAARGERRFPGTRTRRRGSATRTSGSRCSRCGARRGPGWGTRCWPGRRSPAARSGRRGISGRAVRAGSVRSDWEELSELIAAAHVYTIKAYGPDRVVGFSPIPPMSQVS